MARHPILFTLSTPLYRGSTQMDAAIPSGFAQKVRETCPGIIDCFVYPTLVIIVYDGTQVTDEFDIDDPFEDQVMAWAIQREEMFPQKGGTAPVATRYFAEG